MFAYPHSISHTIHHLLTSSCPQCAEPCEGRPCRCAALVPRRCVAASAELRAARLRRPAGRRAAPVARRGQLLPVTHGHHGHRPQEQEQAHQRHTGTETLGTAGEGLCSSLWIFCLFLLFIYFILFYLFTCLFVMKFVCYKN